jgi:hypothetical protein
VNGELLGVCRLAVTSAMRECLGGALSADLIPLMVNDGETLGLVCWPKTSRIDPGPTGGLTTACGGQKVGDYGPRETPTCILLGIDLWSNLRVGLRPRLAPSRRNYSER